MKRKLFVLIAILLLRLNAAAADTTSDPVSSTNWYSQSLRKIHFDMHTPGNIKGVGKDFDADKFALDIKNAGFDTVCFFARCGFSWSYYPTKIGVVHPGLDYDLFGKGFAAMKKQNLRVIAYYHMSRAPEAIALEHPDWLVVSDKDTPLKREFGGVTCCLFTPFIEEHVLPQLKELSSMYKIDGLFLDALPGMAHIDCNCAVCLKARKQAGFENSKTADPEAYYRWQINRVQKRCELILNTLHKHRPDLLVGINYMGGCRHGQSFPIPENTGYLTADIVNPGDVYLYSNYELGCWTWRDKPADCMQMRMLTNWKEWSIRSLESRFSEAALALARGSTYFIGDLLQPESLSLDEEIMDMHRQVNDFIAQRASTRANAHPFAEVAVLHDSFIGDSQPEKQEYGLAAFSALMDDGQTTHVLRDHDLPAHLADYSTLVISHGPSLKEESLNALEKFVKGGGNLIVCGPIPDDNKDAFSKLLGVSFEKTNSFETSYLFLKKTPLADGLKRRIYAVPPIVCLSPVDRVVATKAEVICNLTDSREIKSLGLRSPGELTDAVGISVNRYGKGKAAYCPMPLAQEYWQRGNLNAKYLIQVLVRNLQPQPSVEVESDAVVNVFTARRDQELLVHLISRNAESRPGPPRLEERQPAVHGIKLKLRQATPPHAIMLVPGDISLKWKKEGNLYTVELPPLKVHACCIIQN